MDNNSILELGLKGWGLKVDKNTLLLFEKYCLELKKWNRIFNLTAISSNEDIYIKHFLDSLSSSRVFNFYNQKIADIGSGAGFPGIPLKIFYREIEISLIEASVKKAGFLKEICLKLGLHDVEVINDNVEKVGRNELYREKFDIVVSRALANLNVIIEYAIPLLRNNGKLIAYKGPKGNDEVENSKKALKYLNSRIEKSTEIILPFKDYNRRIIVVEKLGKTDIKFPRNVGIPRKRPLV